MGFFKKQDCRNGFFKNQKTCHGRMVFSKVGFFQKKSSKLKKKNFQTKKGGGIKKNKNAPPRGP